MNISEEITQFGERLRETRKSRDLSQKELAEASGISRRMIGHYETLAKRPSISKVQKLAEALNVSLDYLLGKSELSEEEKKFEEVSLRGMKIVRIFEKLPQKEQDIIYQLVLSFAEKNDIDE
ncbi:MAG: helix-turn-helix transcriptional regulator [bacterium]|nr:helix-turn-helix transcriptional regulator [bacterium]